MHTAVDYDFNDSHTHAVRDKGENDEKKVQRTCQEMRKLLLLVLETRENDKIWWMHAHATEEENFGKYGFEGLSESDIKVR